MALSVTDYRSLTSEAGFSPLIPFYLARWYTREDLGSRVGLWLSMAPLGYVQPHRFVRHIDFPEGS